MKRIVLASPSVIHLTHDFNFQKSYSFWRIVLYSWIILTSRFWWNWVLFSDWKFNFCIVLFQKFFKNNPKGSPIPFFHVFRERGNSSCIVYIIIPILFYYICKKWMTQPYCFEAKNICWIINWFCQVSNSGQWSEWVRGICETVTYGNISTRSEFSRKCSNLSKISCHFFVLLFVRILVPQNPDQSYHLHPGSSKK